MPRDCCRDVSLEKHFQSFRGLFFFCDQQIWETEVEREREKERERGLGHCHATALSCARFFFLSLAHTLSFASYIHSFSFSFSSSLSVLLPLAAELVLYTKNISSEDTIKIPKSQWREGGKWIRIQTLGLAVSAVLCIVL
jgi:hypothetical protein